MLERHLRLVVVVVVAIIVCCVPALVAAQRPRIDAGYLPNAIFITQHGKHVKFYDDLLKRKIVIINFMCVQCPDARPGDVERLRQLHDSLGDSVGKDIFFYTFSTDPTHDTPEVLLNYARNGFGSGWLFLTGRKDDIALMSKKLRVLGGPDPADRDGITTSLLIGNAAAGQWHRTSALDYPNFLLTVIDELIEADDSVWSTRSPSQKENRGEYLFHTECTGCHTIGRGDRVGPDLHALTKRVDRAWLKRFISNPSIMIDSNDPVATALYEKYGRLRMPTLGLAEADIVALIDFLSQERLANQSPR